MILTGERRFWHWFLLAVAAAVVAVASCSAWVVLKWGGSDTTKVADDVYSVTIPVAAAIACWVAARRQRGRGRIGWTLLGLSAFSWGMGSVVWTYFDVVAHIPVPFPSAADAGFLLAVPLAFIGLTSFPSAASRATSRVRTLLDGSILAGSLLFVSWATVLGPTYSQATGGVWEKAIGLAYPLGDVVMGSIVLLLLPRAPRAARLPLVLVGAGILANTVSDSVFTYLQLNNTYSAISNIVDAGWILGFALIGLGALWEAGHKAIVAPRDEDRVTLVATMLPYGPVAVAGVLAVIKELQVGSMEAFLFWDGLAVVVLVVLRQLVTLLENLILNRTLEARVVARTAELQQREERFRALVQNSSDAITIIGADYAILYQSPSFERIFGYATDTLSGQPLATVIHPDDRTRLEGLFDNMASHPGTTAQVEARVQHQDQSTRRCEMTISNLMEESAIGGLVINARDVTDRKALEEQLERQAFQDPLTGIANRALFQDRLRQAVARARRRKEKPAVLFLDLDGFKTVNDSLGHVVGDELLAAVAARLIPTVRIGDTLARLGGDEFALLLEDTEGPDAAALVAARIAEEMKAPFTLQNKQVFVTASIGIAPFTNDEDADELLRNADIAMYLAKANGKGRYEVFNPGMHDALVTQLQLEADLKGAVERGEFYVLYQPLVSLATGRTVGVEALMRWRHPERGIISPVTFIPVAERTGLIVPLGRWILREACRQVEGWRASRPDLELSVNLSGRQLKDTNLVKDVTQALWDSHLDPKALTLEMTESVLMDDVEATRQVLESLHELGLQLAIDDFGTGYSSLSYLRRFPVDSLKIDRSFVNGLGSVDGEPLVGTIMKMGQALKLEIVAEGIENAEQLAALKELLCEIGQGFLFSKPITTEEMTVHLAASASQAAA